MKLLFLRLPESWPTDSFSFQILSRAFMSNVFPPEPTLSLYMHVPQRSFVGLKLFLATYLYSINAVLFSLLYVARCRPSNLPAFSRALPYLPTSLRCPFLSLLSTSFHSYSLNLRRQPIVRAIFSQKQFLSQLYYGIILTCVKIPSFACMVCKL